MAIGGVSSLSFPGMGTVRFRRPRGRKGPVADTFHKISTINVKAQQLNRALDNINMGINIISNIHKGVAYGRASEGKVGIDPGTIPNAKNPDRNLTPNFKAGWNALGIDSAGGKGSDFKAALKALDINTGLKGLGSDFKNGFAAFTSGLDINFEGYQDIPKLIDRIRNLSSQLSGDPGVFDAKIRQRYDDIARGSEEPLNYDDRLKKKMERVASGGGHVSGEFGRIKSDMKETSKLLEKISQKLQGIRGEAVDVFDQQGYNKALNDYLKHNLPLAPQETLTHKGMAKVRKEFDDAEKHKYERTAFDRNAYEKSFQEYKVKEMGKPLQKVFDDDKYEESFLRVL